MVHFRSDFVIVQGNCCRQKGAAVFTAEAPLRYTRPHATYSPDRCRRPRLPRPQPRQRPRPAVRRRDRLPPDQRAPRRGAGTGESGDTLRN